MTIFQKIVGTSTDLRESIFVAATMFCVTAAYEYAMWLFVPDFSVNHYEFFGTWFVLNAVWLVRTRNIQNWIWGIVGVLALGIFFRDIGLPGQQWLQWAFFLPIQVWSWYYWVKGASGDEELPVTTLGNLERFAWVTVIGIGAVVVYYGIDTIAPGSQYPSMDALVVSASMTAQFLMGRKKAESWVLWLGPVNMISIVLFYLAGAYVLTALYIAFFVHAIFGVRNWWIAARETAGPVPEHA